MENKKVNYKAMGKFVMVPHSFIADARTMDVQSRWLYVILSGFRNNNSGLAFPSYQSIQKMTGMTRNKIAKGLKELIEKGWISLNRKRFGSSNVYDVHTINRELQAGVISDQSTNSVGYTEHSSSWLGEVVEGGLD